MAGPGGRVNGEHVMVVPDALPVRIGDGPAVATYLEDHCNAESMEIWVDGMRHFMDKPWPEPRPVPGTPYEAYAHGDWTSDRFAIRLCETP